MGQLRTEWQKFKKAHPNFEKSKNFKKDAGPLMDEYEKLSLKLINKSRDIAKMIAQAEKRHKPLLLALEQYEIFVTAITTVKNGGKMQYKYNGRYYDEVNPGYDKNFAKLKKTVDNAGDKLESAIIKIARDSDQYNLDKFKI